MADLITQVWVQAGAFGLLLLGGYFVIRGLRAEVTRLNTLLDASYGRERENSAKSMENSIQTRLTLDNLLTALKGIGGK